MSANTMTGEVVKLFRFRHPTETEAFVRVMKALKGGVQGEVLTAMEPTGVYGDAIRAVVHGLGIRIEMVSPKRTHDSAEMFDGVPSLHDPKSAVLVAKLAALGLSTRWVPATAIRTSMRALVEERRLELDVVEMAQGRLEALCARHWPELSTWMNVRQQKSALRLLAEYGGPRGVAIAPADEVRSFLHHASHGTLSKEVIEGVIASTKTLGVPMVAEEEGLVRRTAARALEATYNAEESNERLREMTTKDEVLGRLAEPLGAYTAAVIVAMCDPRQYANARQLEKACGLNLREKSSGEKKGRVHMTKRGPGVVRQVLYLFALRQIASDPIVRAWYMKRRGYTEESKRCAVVAVMRKLTRAIWHVANGAKLDYTKLFDTRRLDVNASAKLMVDPRFPPPRTTARSPTRGRRGARPIERSALANT